MKKTICCILAACLLLGVIPASAPAVSADSSAGTVFQPPIPLLDGADGLETLLYELKLNEEDDSVQTVLLLRNPTKSDITAELSLSTEAAAPDTVIFYTDGTQTDIPESITVPADGSLTLQYTYQAANALQNIKVIYFDYSQLVFTGGAKIGRFSASFRLLEEDVPLVTDIQPVSYTFADRTVSVVLDDFSPSCLLDRFLIAKDTWKDLTSNREYEPNDDQQFFLDNYRDWFANGLPFVPERSEMEDYCKLRDQDPNVSYVEYVQHYKALREHTAGFVHALYYLYRKEVLQLPHHEDFDTEYDVSDYDAPLLLMESSCSEAEREAYSTVVCVEYTDNPTLEGHELYVEKTVGSKWVENGNYKIITTEAEAVTQQEALMIKEDAPLTNIRGIPLTSHVAFIPADIGATPEMIAAYADTIGAVYFVRQMLFDGISEPYPDAEKPFILYDSETEEETETVVPCRALIGYCGAENQPIAEASTTLGEKEWAVGTYELREISDPVLEALDFPAILLYRGYVERKDGKDIVNFTEGYYRDVSAGIQQCTAVAETARGQELLSAVQTRRDEIHSRLDAEIAAALHAADLDPPEEPETEPATEPETEPATEESTEPVTEPETEAATEPAPEERSAQIFPYALPVCVLLAGAVVAAVLILLQKKKGKKSP